MTHTALVVVLDRSGSMSTIAKDVQGGFDSLIQEQRKLPGSCAVTLVQFDSSEVEIVYTGKPVHDVPPLVLLPRGGTPLLAAIGRTIQHTEEQLQNLSATAKPDHVLFLIITDGQENQPQGYTLAQIKQMIEIHQGEPWKWVFSYLGANVDAFAESGAIGIPMASSAGYDSNTVGVHSMMAATSSSLKSMRAGSGYGFNAQQRQEMLGSARLTGLCGCPLQTDGTPAHLPTCSFSLKGTP